MKKILICIAIISVYSALVSGFSYQKGLNDGAKTVYTTLTLECEGEQPSDTPPFGSDVKWVF